VRPVTAIKTTVKAINLFIRVPFNHFLQGGSITF